MPRLTHPAAVHVYAAAQRFIDNALRADDSLFTPGTPIWSAPVIDDLYQRFVEHPDESADSFENKFRRQLRGDVLTPPANAPAETYQLAGELLYIHLLPANGISGKSKRHSINTVLKWSPAPVAIPAELDQTLDEGIARASQYYLIGRPFQITFLLEFIRRWKNLDATDRERYLGDPWAFKGFVKKVPVGSAYAQRELLLHLVHPETFEPIMAREHKQRIVTAFANLTDRSLTHVDQQIAQIRARLTPQYGEGFHFYEDHIKGQWLQQDTADNGDEADEAELKIPLAASMGHMVGIDSERLRIWQDELTSDNPINKLVATTYPDWLRSRFGQALTIVTEGDRWLRFYQDSRLIQSIWFNQKWGPYVLLHDPIPWDLAALQVSLTRPKSLKRREPYGWRFYITNEIDLRLFTSVTERALQHDEQRAGALPYSLGQKLGPYVQLATHLVDDNYTPAALRDILIRTVPPIAPGISPPEPSRLVNDLMCLRLLEPLDGGLYRRWQHLGDATPTLLLKYAALTLLVPINDEAYDLPALSAPFDGLPHPPDRWPHGEPLLRWYEEAGLVRRNPDGTWQSLPGTLEPLEDERPTAQAVNTFLANLRRARSEPGNLSALSDKPLRMLPTDILEARIAEIQRELLIDRETILRVYRSLVAGHHVILSGPPGTGKTHLAKILPGILWRDEVDTVRLTLPIDPAFPPTASLLEEPLRREGYLVEVVTATEEWGVRHVIGGITPKIQRDERGTSLVYTVAHGCLTRAVLANYELDGDLPVEGVELPRREHADASGNRYRGLWLVIDEFTRAQVDSAFGGLLTTLGGQRQPALTFPTDAGEQVVRLPRDFRLIGTLNSFDRHFLNQISEAMKRRFTFIDVMPPGRERRAEEQAMAIYRAIGGLHENGVQGFTAEPDLGRATWDVGLSVHRVEQSGSDGSLVRYEINWPTEPQARAAIDGFWRIFEAARVYRQLGTAQAETVYRTLFAGRAASFAWDRALDSALADTLADQLQVIARDELRVLLELLASPNDSEALKGAIVAILGKLSGPRQSAHLLQLRLVDPSIDVTKHDVLTKDQVEKIFGTPASLSIGATGLFARRLTAFVNEQGL